MIIPDKSRNEVGVAYQLWSLYAWLVFITSLPRPRRGTCSPPTYPWPTSRQIVILNFLTISAALKNAGKNCWSDCGKKDGPCTWCGTQGLCCRKGWRRNGCDGKIGDNYHMCVLKGAGGKEPKEPAQKIPFFWDGDYKELAKENKCVEKGECFCGNSVWKICDTKRCKSCQNLKECNDYNMDKDLHTRWIVQSHLKASTVFHIPWGSDYNLPPHFLSIWWMNHLRGSSMIKLARKLELMSRADKDVFKWHTPIQL